MKVMTTEEIQTAKGIIPAGQLIDIPESALEKLSGKVKVIDPRQLIKEMLTELNQRQWQEGIFSEGIPDYSEIDRACLAGDIPRLQAAIAVFTSEALNPV